MTTGPVRLMPTPSQTVGPFFDFGLARDATLGTVVTSTATAGERIRLRMTVVDGHRAPVPDALVEIYQADSEGRYATRDTRAGGFTGFGRLATGADGTCVFETIRPGRVSDGHGGLQAAHVNICVFARGLLRHLYTRLYFANEPGQADDAILTLVPADRRHTLMASPVEGTPGAWSFEVRLQGEDETVFFDL